MRGDVLVYSIDGADTIAGVDANWRSFAEDNCWRSSCGPEEVVGRLLWDFIQDYETRHLYQELFRRLRDGRRCPPLECFLHGDDDRFRQNVGVAAVVNVITRERAERARFRRNLPR